MAALVAVTLSTSGAALAQPKKATATEIAKAREEFRHGLALEAAGDWTGALPVFKSVALVKSTPQVRYHIAQCEEKTGDYVGAFGSYKLALVEAQDAKVRDVEAASNSAIAALEPKIPKVTLIRGKGAEVARVLFDGREIGPTVIGKPMSTNPGPHHVEATTPSRLPFSLDLTLADAETKAIEITLEEPKPEVTAPKPVEPPKEVPVPPKPPPPPPSTSGLTIAGIVLGSAGIAGLGASGVFFYLRQNAIDELDSVCGANRQSCPASAASTRDNGAMYSTISTAALIGGGVGLAAGGTLLLISRSKTPSSPSVGFLPMAPFADAGASLVGRF